MALSVVRWVTCLVLVCLLAVGAWGQRRGNLLGVMGPVDIVSGTLSENFTLRATCEGMWLLNDTDNATIDDNCADAGTQGGANNGTTTGTGGVPASATVPTGSPASYRSGDFELADSDQSSVADNAVFEAVNLTVCAWVNDESAPATDLYIISKNAGGTGFGHLVSGGDQFGEINGVFEQGQTAVALATWTHICTRYDSGGTCADCTDDRVEIFSNAALNCTGQCDTQTVSPTFGTEAVFIGSSNAAGFFDGLLHEVVYFSAALENEEICSICRCGVQGSATTVADRSASCGSCALPAGITACN